MDEGRLGVELVGADGPAAQAPGLAGADAPGGDVPADGPAPGGLATADDAPSADGPAPGGLAPADDAAGRIARLADELLPALIARLDASGLGALEVRTDAWRIRLKKPHGRRQPAGRGTAPVAQAVAQPAAHPVARPAAPVAAPRGPAPAAAGSRGAPRAASSASPTAPTADPHPEVVATSPGVGYFTPREGIPAGDGVRAGDILGFVDVLGIRQDVVAPEDGRIAEILAQAGEAVEYGQPLVRIGPYVPALDLPEAP